MCAEKCERAHDVQELPFDYGWLEPNYDDEINQEIEFTLHDAVEMVDTFSEDGSMKDSAYRDRVVDVMEELMRFTYLTRDYSEFLVDRYSERKDAENKADAKSKTGTGCC